MGEEQQVWLGEATML